MDSEGYIIFKNIVKICPKFLKKIKRKGAVSKPIFNHTNTRKNDLKRTQFRISLKKTDVEGIDLFLDEAHSDKIKSRWVVVYSHPNCKSQPPHTDWIPNFHWSLGQSALGCFVSLEENTKLDVWPGSHLYVRGENDNMKPIRRKRLLLQKGDVILFRSDLVHAGSSYKTSNARLHCFLDSSSIRRAPNTTWLVHSHGPETLKKNILL